MMKISQMSSQMPETPKFFGRRQGRTIHKTKTYLLQNFLSKIEISAQTDFSSGTLFNTNVQKISLEIGFGDGAHLAGMALKEPQTGFIGIEVFKNGIAHLLTLLTGVKEGADIVPDVSLLPQRTDNVRIFADDARLLFPRLPDSFVDTVYLLFPDPWPKKRHAERRFINTQNLDEIARILKKDGTFLVATDHKVYKSWVLRQMHNRKDFVWTAKSSADWRNPPADWVETKYQQKALKEGRHPVFFEYRRL